MARTSLKFFLFFFLLPFSISAISLFAVEPPSPPTYGVRMEKTWIPMKDGVRLAATLYMPDGAKPGEKFPALLEYLPYRKDDGTAAEDYRKHAYFARRGYVGVRVDIRGFGASEGVPPEREYSEQEQVDGEQVIAWLAHQPWSNGNVGMFGISWGGFTAEQMAMRHAPALKSDCGGVRDGRIISRRRSLHGWHGACRRIRIEHGHGAGMGGRAGLFAR